jgi:uncharacterized protein YjiS (DUF1127 family)
MRTFNPKDVIIDVRSWYQAATEKRELLAMDDRMLRDIGITRVDADRLANQPLPPIVRIERRPPSDPLRIDAAMIEAHVAQANRLRDDTIRRSLFAAARRLRSAVGWLRPQAKARIRKLAPVARYTK